MQNLRLRDIDATYQMSPDGREGRHLDLPPEEGGAHRKSSDGGRQAGDSPRPRRPVWSLCPGPCPVVEASPRSGKWFPERWRRYSDGALPGWDLG